MTIAADAAKPNARAADGAEGPRKRLRKGEGEAAASDVSPAAGTPTEEKDAEDAEVRLSPGFSNAYAGFVVPCADYAVERLDVDAVGSAARFFREFVAPRKPVVLVGFLRDAGFAAPAKWTNAYLAEAAGDEVLAVERRADTRDKFGRGVEVQMTFRALLALLERGDELHYLTTQDVEAEADGRPEVMARFVQRLRGDFPLRPALMGNLVPQNVNVWMGNNKHGSSTGLHHDYHDNLYILLRGRKRFRLYSPADAERMYTRGLMTRVHANGRINYEGEDTTAYGADPFAEAAALAAIDKDEAERELAQAEQALERGEPGAEQRVEQAEQRLDAAMLAVLRADKDEEAGESDAEDGEEAEDGEDGENGAFHFDDEDDDVEDDDDEQELELDEMALDPEEVAADGERRKVDQTVKDPVSFSRVDTSRLVADVEALHAQFPRFREATPAFCELAAGEMLFLPASWFHEVESFGSGDGHLALNYWFHPPDQLDSFETPYSSPFWPRDWAMRFAGQDEDESERKQQDDK
jgi:uncharacterized protein (DUF4415 family)